MRLSWSFLLSSYEKIALIYLTCTVWLKSIEKSRVYCTWLTGTNYVRPNHKAYVKRMLFRRSVTFHSGFHFITLFYDSVFSIVYWHIRQIFGIYWDCEKIYDFLLLLFFFRKYQIIPLIFFFCESTCYIVFFHVLVRKKQRHYLISQDNTSNRKLKIYIYIYTHIR